MRNLIESDNDTSFWTQTYLQLLADVLQCGITASLSRFTSQSGLQYVTRVICVSVLPRGLDLLSFFHELDHDSKSTTARIVIHVEMWSGVKVVTVKSNGKGL